MSAPQDSLTGQMLLLYVAVVNHRDDAQCRCRRVCVQVSDAFRVTSDELPRDEMTSDQNSLCFCPLTVGQHIWVPPCASSAVHLLSVAVCGLHMLTLWAARAYVHDKHAYIKPTRTSRRTGTVVGIVVRLSWG